MKKITLLLAGLMASGMASAVQLASPSGDVTRVDCTLLNEDVSINLTSNVVAGVQCNDVAISLSACHTAGRVTSRSSEVTTCTDPADNTTCTTTVQTVTGAAYPTASTLRGTVTSQYPGSLCTEANAESNAGTAENLPTSL
ncbi:MAG: hypothetical protein LPK18_03195 [Pseudomonadaceae bacterium]|nr:hypothetical protein [Pseudomonadaceae bacterium]